MHSVVTIYISLFFLVVLSAIVMIDEKKNDTRVLKEIQYTVEKCEKVDSDVAFIHYDQGLSNEKYSIHKCKGSNQYRIINEPSMITFNSIKK